MPANGRWDFTWRLKGIVLYCFHEECIWTPATTLHLYCSYWCHIACSM